MGQPIAIVVIPLVVPIAAPPVTPITALLNTPIAVLLATPTAAPAGTSTLSGPPSARYLYPNIIRDRLNYTFNSLAIGLKSV